LCASAAVVLAGMFFFLLHRFLFLSAIAHPRIHDMSTLKKLAAGALLALASAPSSAFLIELRSEEELADAVDSYPALLVNFHDPTSEASRKRLGEVRRASKTLVPDVQVATVDLTAEDFQNVAESVDRNFPLQFYINKQALEAKITYPINEAQTAENIDAVVRAVAHKGGARKPVRAKRAQEKTRADSDEARPTKTIAEKQAALAEKSAAVGAAAKEKQPPTPPTQTQHSDDDILEEPQNSRVRGCHRRFSARKDQLVLVLVLLVLLCCCSELVLVLVLLVLLLMVVVLLLSADPGADAGAGAGADAGSGYGGGVLGLIAPAPASAPASLPWLHLLGLPYLALVSSHPR
jgi:hypothetical protein